MIWVQRPFWIVDSSRVTGSRTALDHSSSFPEGRILSLNKNCWVVRTPNIIDDPSLGNDSTEIQL